jgi:hypothetical protein
MSLAAITWRATADSTNRSRRHDTEQTFSTTNCPTRVRLDAPNALRTPISEARSMMRLTFRFTRLIAGKHHEQDHRDDDDREQGAAPPFRA